MRLIFGLFLILFSLGTAVARYSAADFVVKRDISGNAFRAAVLDFTSRNAASEETATSLFQLPSLKPGGVAVQLVRLLNEGTTNPPLSVKVAVKGETTPFCQRLELAVRQDWQELARDGLASFQLVLKPVSSQTDLIFILSLPKSGNEGKGQCLFDLIFETRREGTGGFSARRILSSFAAN